MLGGALNGLSLAQQIGFGLGIAVVVAMSGWILWKEYERRQIMAEVELLTEGGLTQHDLDVLQDEQDLDDETVDAIEQRLTDKVELDPPDPGGSIFSLLKEWRHRVKARKMARKGYVKWYKAGSYMPRPQWVKPERDGTGVWKYYNSDDGLWYYFPEEAMLHDAATGAYVCIHKDGEATPVNLRDPIMPATEADRLQEAINLEVESDPPGILDKLNIEPAHILFGGVAIALVIGAVVQATGGV